VLHVTQYHSLVFPRRPRSIPPRFLICVLGRKPGQQASAFVPHYQRVLSQGGWFRNEKISVVRALCLFYPSYSPRVYMMWPAGVGKSHSTGCIVGETSWRCKPVWLRPSISVRQGCYRCRNTSPLTSRQCQVAGERSEFTDHFEYSPAAQISECTEHT